MQLSRYRSQIEARLKLGELSIRAALRLIAELEGRVEKTPKAKREAAIRAGLRSGIDAEITAALTELGLERFLQVMPADWRAKIQRHAGGQVVSLLKQEHGGVRLKNLKPRHLELVADNTSIETKH
jgi:hypothetical protein